MKKRFVTILIGAIFLMNAHSNANERKGIIGKVYENGLPVIYKLVNEMPQSSIIKSLPWLTVIAWKYDGTSNNGMPPKNENQQMIILEDTIENKIENDKVLRHAYSRTGNNLKGFVYYIHDQDQFLDALNRVLAKQPKYPIEIKFFKDTKWEDFRKLLDDFKGATNKPVPKS